MPLKLFRRGKVWYVRGTVRGTRVYESTGTADRRQAEAYRAKREAELWQRSVFGGRGTRTFAEAALIYLEGRELSPSYRATLRRVVAYFGPMRLEEIDQSALDAYIRRYHRGAAPGTIVRAVITPVTAIMRAAAKRGWCDPPAFERPRVRSPEPRFLTEEEAERLIAASAPHLRPLVIFLLYTGARLHEALRLQWRDVDLHARRVTLRQTKTGEVLGVPLHDRVFLALASLPHRDGHVFRTPRGTPYYDSGGRGGSPIKTAFKAACRRAGLEGVRVHDLRHTYASWLVQRGVHLRTVAELLGHRTLQMVQRYAHLAPEHLRAAVDLLPDGAGSVQRPARARSRS